MASNNTRPADDANQKEQHQVLTPDQVVEARIRYLPEEAGRYTTPGAFLLTRTEAKHILKASLIAVDAWSGLLLNNPPKGAVGKSIEPKEYLPRIEEAWKEENISVSTLKRINSKVTEGKYWTFFGGITLAGGEKREDAPESERSTAETKRHIFIQFENKEIFRTFSWIDGEGTGHEFIEALNPIDRAQIAEIPEGIKYLPYNELEALNNVRSFLHELGAFEDKGPEAPPNLQWMPSSPVIDIFTGVGRQSISKAVEGSLSFNGQGTRRIVSAKGVTIITTTTDDALFLSLSGDADRVLKTFIKEAYIDQNTNNLTYDIPVADLAKRIGLKDARELTRKIYKDGATEPTTRLDMILDEIYGVSLDWKSIDGKYSFKGRVVGERGILPRKGRGGSIVHFAFSRGFKDHIKDDTTGKYLTPDNLTEIRDDNAYKVAGEIFTEHHQHAGGKNEGIIGVKTLLKVTNIVTYEELGKDKGKASQRIIAPFKNVLEYLVDIGYLQDWDFYYPAGVNHGARVSDADLERVSRNYPFFSSLMIHYVIGQKYKPDYAELIKNRKSRKKIADKAKAKKAQKQGTQ